jgi:hypothetical protein
MLIRMHKSTRSPFALFPLLPSILVQYSVTLLTMTAERPLIIITPPSPRCVQAPRELKEKGDADTTKGERLGRTTLPITLPLTPSHSLPFNLTMPPAINIHLLTSAINGVIKVSYGGAVPTEVQAIVSACLISASRTVVVVSNCHVS